MPRLLIVHHTASPGTHALLEAAHRGATTPEITGVDVVLEPALGATASDVLGADGYLLGAPVNLGYMAGALKHFFDTIYYPCLESTAGRPFGCWFHGDDDTTGALRALDRITTGLRWKPVRPPISFTGRPTTEQLDEAWELGATLAALLAEGLA